MTVHFLATLWHLGWVTTVQHFKCQVGLTHKKIDCTKWHRRSHGHELQYREQALHCEQQLQLHWPIQRGHFGERKIIWRSFCLDEFRECCQKGCLDVCEGQLAILRLEHLIVTIVAIWMANDWINNWKIFFLGKMSFDCILFVMRYCGLFSKAKPQSKHVKIQTPPPPKKNAWALR
jgi:hypothetical protein